MTSCTSSYYFYFDHHDSEIDVSGVWDVAYYLVAINYQNHGLFHFLFNLNIIHSIPLFSYSISLLISEYDISISRPSCFTPPSYFFFGNRLKESDLSWLITCVFE